MEDRVERITSPHCENRQDWRQLELTDPTLKFKVSILEHTDLTLELTDPTLIYKAIHFNSPIQRSKKISTLEPTNPTLKYKVSIFELTDPTLEYTELILKYKVKVCSHITKLSPLFLLKNIGPLFCQ